MIVLGNELFQTGNIREAFYSAFPSENEKKIRKFFHISTEFLLNNEHTNSILTWVRWPSKCLQHLIRTIRALSRKHLREYDHASLRNRKFISYATKRSRRESMGIGSESIDLFRNIKIKNKVHVGLAAVQTTPYKAWWINNFILKLHHNATCSLFHMIAR